MPPRRDPAAYAVEHLTYTNNLARHNQYGVKGQGTGVGTPSLMALTRRIHLDEQRAGGGAGQPYPAITWFPTVAVYRVSSNQTNDSWPQALIAGQQPMGVDVGVDWNQQIPWLQSPKRVRVTK